MEKKMRFGIIGGGMAGPLSAGALRDIPDAEMVAFADINEEVCQSFSRRYDIKRAYTDYRKMLECDDIDAICVVTPPFLHEDMVVAAAKAGKHVMCEKPISIDLPSADRMIAACKDAGVTLGVIFMYRFMDQAVLIKRALEEGRLGRLISVTCTGKSFRDDAYYASGQWRGTWRGEGGGSLISQTVHFIDLMLFLVGDVSRLTGKYKTTIHSDIEVDDIAVAEFEFKNGALGTVVSSTAIRPGYPRRLEIHGERGSIILQEEEIVEWRVEGMNEDDYLTKAKQDSGDTTAKAGFVNSEYHRRQIVEFMQAIREGRKPAVDGLEGRRALEFIRAIYQSSDTGKEVVFPVDDSETYGKKTAW
jgi:UDP-N-acetyl-2-amino-2-deoxyglucuronate dehydrogenase